MHSHERHTLTDAVDEFLSQIVVIPPGKAQTNKQKGRNSEERGRNVGEGI